MCDASSVSLAGIGSACSEGIAQYSLVRGREGQYVNLTLCPSVINVHFKISVLAPETDSSFISRPVLQGVMDQKYSSSYVLTFPVEKKHKYIVSMEYGSENARKTVVSVLDPFRRRTLLRQDASPESLVQPAYAGGIASSSEPSSGVSKDGGAGKKKRKTSPASGDP